LLRPGFLGLFARVGTSVNEQQRAILAIWVKEVVFEMGCSYVKAQRFFAVPLKDVLKPAYEEFDRLRFERGRAAS
jgi:hypothetical protein